MQMETPRWIIVLLDEEPARDGRIYPEAVLVRTEFHGDWQQAIDFAKNAPSAKDAAAVRGIVIKRA